MKKVKILKKCIVLLEKSDCIYICDCFDFIMHEGLINQKKRHEMRKFLNLNKPSRSRFVDFFENKFFVNGSLGWWKHFSRHHKDYKKIINQKIKYLEKLIELCQTQEKKLN